MIANLIVWLKEPSTIKAIVALAGALGYVIDPTRITDLMGAVMLIQAAVNMFYDRNPAKPPTP